MKKFTKDKWGDEVLALLVLFLGGKMIEEIVFNFEEHVDFIGKHCKKIINVQKAGFYIVAILIYIALLNYKDITSFLSILAFIVGIYLIIFFVCKNKLYKNIGDFVLKKINWQEKKELERLKGKKYRVTVMKKYDELQKKWIKNYCHRKKINSFQKTLLVKQEVEKLYSIKENRLVRPVLIFTFLFTIWEKVVDYIFENFETPLAVITIIFIIGIIYVIASMYEKEWKEMQLMFAKFDKYKGKERLINLLTYNAISQKK